MRQQFTMPRCLTTMLWLLALGCLLPGSKASAAIPAAERIGDYIAAHDDAARIVVIGELHGTVQTPDIAGAVAERLLEREAVTVALEIPQQEQAALDAYLRSDGAADARHALLAGTFWQRPRERSDGRRSEAMVQLIDRLRAAYARNAAVSIVAFDDDAFHRAGVDRDAAMAQRLRASYAAHAPRRMIVLTGNYHARVTAAGPMRGPDGEPVSPPPPMASLLRDLPLRSIDVRAHAGQFWGCLQACGPQRVGGGEATGNAVVAFDEHPDARHGHHAQLWLPVLDASPPVPGS